MSIWEKIPLIGRLFERVRHRLPPAQEEPAEIPLTQLTKIAGDYCRYEGPFSTHSSNIPYRQLRLAAVKRSEECWDIVLEMRMAGGSHAPKAITAWEEIEMPSYDAAMQSGQRRFGGQDLPLTRSVGEMKGHTNMTMAAAVAKLQTLDGLLVACHFNFWPDKNPMQYTPDAPNVHDVAKRLPPPETPPPPSNTPYR